MNHRGNPDRQKNGIRVFIGSDTLRAHNADILFSQNLMTIYGDDRNKLSVPFARPEDEHVFKNLCTVNVQSEKIELKATAPSFTPTETKAKSEVTAAAVSSALTREGDRKEPLKVSVSGQQPTAMTEHPLSPLGDEPVMKPTSLNQTIETNSEVSGPNGNMSDSEKIPDSAISVETSEAMSSADSSRRESSGGIWGSWRQGTASNGSDNGESTSGYQKATRGGRNMKVLKPSKSMGVAAATVPSRSSSTARTGAAYEPAPSRASGELRRKSQVSGAENIPLRWESKKPAAEEPKIPRTIATIPRSSNPIGGASAFAWMNPGKPKASATTAE